MRAGSGGGAAAEAEEERGLEGTDRMGGRPVGGVEEGGYPARPGDVRVIPRSGAHERWSPVRYRVDRDVETEDLLAVLEAARWAPSSWGEQPWRFLVARRHDPWRPRLEEALSRGNQWARRASVLIVGMAARNRTRDGEPNAHAAHDLGIALGGLLHEARARGLIAHPMGGFDPERVRADFAVPADVDPMWIAALGHHDPDLDDPKLREREERPRRRKALEEMVFGSGFGVPLAW